MGRAWGKDDESFKGRAICTELFTKELDYLVRKGSLSPKQSGAVKSAAAGAVMTMSKAVDWGYKVSNKCPLCGQQNDTLHHRVYRCPAVRDEVKEAVPSWFWEEINGPMDVSNKF